MCNQNHQNKTSTNNACTHAFLALTGLDIMNLFV